MANNKLPPRDIEMRLGNAQTDAYLPMLMDKHVAVVGNHTSVVDGVHLVDTLLSSGVNVMHVFAPEHGFRGEAANGADIQDGIDAATGLKVHSLHGKHKKPQPEHLVGHRRRGVRHPGCRSPILHLHQFHDARHGGVR